MSREPSFQRQKHTDRADTHCIPSAPVHHPVDAAGTAKSMPDCMGVFPCGSVANPGCPA